ncbi:hypothetical protein [Halorubrum cibi]|uniref:DUF5602 domain-containing protein n=1 Tax=Halorubrum cibi TaxID=413815 RepID=A0A521CWR9_9EURY|nr:hypothetical protein [Halorubrum cibi]SMO63887.1 hypothetical protein SAMN06264867_105168 [Halorubrum cibi]
MSDRSDPALDGANGENDSIDGRRFTPDRRTLLGSAVTGSALLGGIGVTGAAGQGNGKGRGKGRSNEDGNDGSGGFPPDGITEYGRAVNLGDGRVRTFTSETSSGEPKYHGVEFDRDAFDGLPEADDLADADNRAETDKYREDGQAATVHFKESLQFFVPFPDAAETPFTFLGLNWNPGGHFGGKGAWLKPHFDVHFHMLDPATVDAIEGPGLPPYDTGNDEYTSGPGPDDEGKVTETNFDFDQLPEGYERAPDPVVDQRYIRDMGEHTAPSDAPELPDGPDDVGDPDGFSNTLIQGFVGDEEGSRLAFVEPMVTLEFLEGFDGTEKYDVPQPREYPHDLRHPRGYSVRDLPSKDAIAIVLEDFEEV